MTISSTATASATASAAVVPSGRVTADHAESGTHIVGETVERDGVSRLRVYPGQPEGEWLSLDELDSAHGWTVTVRPIHDEDPLPTHPGAYLDAVGSLWMAQEDGGWCFAPSGRVYRGRTLHEVRRNAPFTPLLTLQDAAVALLIQAAREHAASGGRSDLRADESAVLHRVATGRALTELV